MRGKNPQRPPSKGNGDTLDIQEIFATFQGEGPYVGVPAVFIRLGGCNLACRFCDTEFESFTRRKTADIVKKVKELAAGKQGKRLRNLVVITGGEPLLQPIARLCEDLLSEDFKIQLETNGTIYRKLDERVEFICSPKNTGRGFAPIREDVMSHVRALKFVVSASDPLYKNIAELGQKKFNIPVYIQPMDEDDVRKNAENQQLAMRLAQENSSIFCLQIQKIANFA